MWCSPVHRTTCRSSAARFGRLMRLYSYTCLCRSGLHAHRSAIRRGRAGSNRAIGHLEGELFSRKNGGSVISSPDAQSGALVLTLARLRLPGTAATGGRGATRKAPPELGGRAGRVTRSEMPGHHDRHHVAIARSVAGVTPAPPAQQRTQRAVYGPKKSPQGQGPPKGPVCAVKCRAAARGMPRVAGSCVRG
jgi:hypothetical protein